MNYDKIIIMDIECYKNYFLVMFRRVITGQVLSFDKFEGSQLNIKNILAICSRYTVVTFNGINYDLPVLQAACAGFTNKGIHNVSKMIIEDNMRPWEVRRQCGFPAIEMNHIDIIEVCPLRATLKIYGGRCNCPKMQDLPIDPYDAVLENQIQPMKVYCGNDLELTEIVLKDQEPGLDLRIRMSEQYGLDLRSKSDAQIAEAVIKRELRLKHGVDAKKPSLPSGTSYRYRPPANLVFTSHVLRNLFDDFKQGEFKVSSKTGHMELPPSLHNKKIAIGSTTYKIGLGGLHSCDKSTRYESDGLDTILRDYDVTSYYPYIILNNEYFPKHLGKGFLSIYESFVKRRVKAKREGNKSVADSLRITINGSFGKFASKWSCLYSPDLMMQVTVTGQLSLLMLIDRLELNGIRVVSANTDGVVIYTDSDNENLINNITSQWEKDTNYNLESNDYRSLNNRDVNNYIAIYENDKPPKGKGAFVSPSIWNNPTGPICSEAVKSFLDTGKAIEDTVNECVDVTKFVTIRTVNGGAVKDGELLGKSIRWYYGKYELDAIFYSTNGNKVNKSQGAVPLMQLPETLPDDIDYEWYIAEAYKMLKSVGFKNKALQSNPSQATLDL